MLDERESRSGKNRGAWILAAIGVVVGLAYLIYLLASGPSKLQRKNVAEVVQLKLVQPPPPPPPPPPKVIEQIRPQPQEFKPEMQPEDEPPPSPQPPGPPSVDGPGQGAPDAFGLVGGGSGGWGGESGSASGTGSKFGWYAALIKNRAQDSLQKQRRLNGKRYKLTVQLWLSDDGLPERVELVGSTGKSELDELIRETLVAMSRMPQPPPADMPKPVVMQVTSS